MSSTSSTSSSSSKILKGIAIDGVATKHTKTANKDPPPSSHQNQRNYFAVLPAELLEKVFTAIDDHDSYQNMAFTSKQMHIIAKPYLMAKRKLILDELCNSKPRASALTNLERCKELIQRGEWYLKRALRTYVKHTCGARNLPIEKVQTTSSTSQARASAASSAGAGGVQKRAGSSSGVRTWSGAEHLIIEEIAKQLLQVALRHCYAFSDFYRDTIMPAISNMKRHRLDRGSVKALKAGFAYRIFENFLFENPELSVFSDLHCLDFMLPHVNKGIRYFFDGDLDYDDGYSNYFNSAFPDDSSPSSHQNQKNYFPLLPAKLIGKIFTGIDDHYTLQNMAFTSKQMHTIAKPYLMAKRKQILDELCKTYLERCKELIRREEQSLKQALRANQEMTRKAHKMFYSLTIVRTLMRAAGSSGAQELAGSSSAGDHQTDSDQRKRAYQVLKIALRHCYTFSDFFLDTIVPAISNMKNHEQMSEESVEAFKAGFAYRIFENFLRENPELRTFTDVPWPDPKPCAKKRRYDDDDIIVPMRYKSKYRFSRRW